MIHMIPSDMNFPTKQIARNLSNRYSGLAQIEVNTKHVWNHHLAASRLTFTHQPRHPLPHEQPENSLAYWKKNNNFYMFGLPPTQ